VQASLADSPLARAVRAPAPAWFLVALIGIAAGAYLRMTQLPIQILLDDEWHAIHQLFHADARGILTSFGLADYSIPLTLYYRFLAFHGGLTEWQMHLPLMLAGIALLVVAPLLLRRDAPAAVLATWIPLLAISPLHVYLSPSSKGYVGKRHAEEFGVAPVPAGPAGRFNFAGGSALAATSFTPHLREALALVRFLMGKNR
jgi:hypothetical protein